MSVIKIYGPGCVKCQKVEETVRKVVAEAGVSVQVEKITDTQELLALGVLTVPAITDDGVVKLVGRIPHPQEIREWLI